MAGEMALIDETDTVGNFADGELACGKEFLRFFSPWHRRHTGEASGPSTL